MPNHFPKTQPTNPTPTFGRAVLSAVLGFGFAGAVYGVSLWLALLLLRSQGVISEIISYRYCALLGYIFLFVRAFDHNLLSKK